MHSRFEALTEIPTTQCEFISFSLLYPVHIFPSEPELPIKSFQYSVRIKLCFELDITKASSHNVSKPFYQRDNCIPLIPIPTFQPQATRWAPQEVGGIFYGKKLQRAVKHLSIINCKATCGSSCLTKIQFFFFWGKFTSTATFLQQLEASKHTKEEKEEERYLMGSVAEVVFVHIVGSVIDVKCFQNPRSNSSSHH